ncbi:hypothetical protein NC652_022373 [Populus alba x Populus x berolinensis]|nr:hypothetical protein NC652_022373 [Populus alba x Populus x berolinensis]
MKTMQSGQMARIVNCKLLMHLQFAMGNCMKLLPPGK